MNKYNSCFIDYEKLDFPMNHRDREQFNLMFNKIFNLLKLLLNIDLNSDVYSHLHYEYNNEHYSECFRTILNLSEYVYYKLICDIEFCI